VHYLKSMQAAGTTEGAAVAAQMHALPVDDFFAKGQVREDGRLLHDFFLAEVKSPSQSTAPWDYYKIRRIIQAQEAAQPLAQSKCARVRL
jgi:branched-chain amino acid transport system substrate-binding protein